MPPVRGAWWVAADRHEVRADHDWFSVIELFWEAWEGGALSGLVWSCSVSSLVFFKMGPGRDLRMRAGEGENAHFLSSLIYFLCGISNPVCHFYHVQYNLYLMLKIQMDQFKRSFCLKHPHDELSLMSTVILLFYEEKYTLITCKPAFVVECVNPIIYSFFSFLHN